MLKRIYFLEVSKKRLGFGVRIDILEGNLILIINIMKVFGFVVCGKVKRLLFY